MSNPGDGVEAGASTPRAGTEPSSTGSTAAERLLQSIHDGSYWRDPLQIAERFLIAMFVDNAPSRRQRPRRPTRRRRPDPITAGPITAGR